MEYFDKCLVHKSPSTKLLVQNTNLVYQSQFIKKFEEDEYDEKAFPMLSISLKGMVSKILFWGLHLRPTSFPFLSFFRLFVLYISPVHA